MDNKRKIFTKKQIFTIPNLLSFFRILLVPLIIGFYIVKKNYYASVGVLLISGLSDIVDGFIARKYNMISDLGKILDPFADKLTQFSIIVCLSLRYKFFIFLACFFLIKELIMALCGYWAMRHNVVSSAKWHGKLNTVLLYLVILILLIFPNIQVSVANILILLSLIMMIISLILYITFYLNLRKKLNSEDKKC